MKFNNQDKLEYAIKNNTSFYKRIFLICDECGKWKEVRSFSNYSSRAYISSEWVNDGWAGEVYNHQACLCTECQNNNLEFDNIFTSLYKNIKKIKNKLEIKWRVFLYQSV